MTSPTHHEFDLTGQTGSDQGHQEPTTDPTHQVFDMTDPTDPQGPQSGAGNWFDELFPGADDPTQQPTEPDDPGFGPAMTGDVPAESEDQPNAGQPDGIDGDPQGESAYWFEQAVDGWCGPASVSEVIAEATGSHNLEATELEVVTRAEELGLLSHTGSDPSSGWSGMMPADIATLLQSFGVPAAEGTGSIAMLEEALRDGDHVIAAVDSTTIWDAEGAENVADPGQADHALVVTGIDEHNGVVYLNDPGRPEGGETQVSLAVFEKAWGTSGNAVVVAETGDKDGSEADGGTGGSTETGGTGQAAATDTAIGSHGLDDVLAAPGAKSWILPITLSHS